MSFSFENAHEQDARDCLLKYYNSKAVAHGSYVLSVAIGFFTFIQAIQYIPEMFPFVTIPIVENSFKDFVIFSIFSAFITFGLYLFARTLYWGVLSGYALHVPPIPFPEAYRRDPAATNLIHRLNQRCVAYFNEHHSCVKWFAGTEAPKLFILRYVIIFLVSVGLLLILF